MVGGTQEALMPSSFTSGHWWTMGIGGSMPSFEQPLVNPLSSNGEFQAHTDDSDYTYCILKQKHEYWKRIWKEGMLRGEKETVKDGRARSNHTPCLHI